LHNSPYFGRVSLRRFAIESEFGRKKSEKWRQPDAREVLEMRAEQCEPGLCDDEHEKNVKEAENEKSWGE
jgi:hypothetical protein